MRILCAALACAAVVLAAGCGGGSSGGGTPSVSGDGAATIAITDAATDQIAVFDVGLKQVALRRADGSAVSTLPAATRVDLAQLVDLTDIVARATVPPGVYTQLLLTLNFDGATVQLSTPTATVPATLRRPDGTTLTGDVIETVEFDPQAPLVVAPGTARFVAIDFNLDASLDIDEAANVVTVNAAIAAEAEPTSAKPVRFPALLASVSTPTASFVADLRPRSASVTHGNITVHVNTTTFPTLFAIDGAIAQGAAGLQALAAKPAGTRLFVQGVFDPQNHRLEARTVLAGSSTPGAGRDAIDGWIVARQENVPTAGQATLTLRAAAIFPQAGGVTVTRTATAIVSATSVVVNDFPVGAQPVSGTAELLDPGSHVTLLGALDQPTGTTLTSVVFARRHESSVLGAVTATAGSTVTLSLVRVGPFRVQDVSPGGSWDPAAFTVDTAGVLAALPASGTPLRAIGFFNDTSAAPPAFRARSIVDRSNAESAFGAYWERQNVTPPCLNGASAASIDLDLRPLAAGCQRAVHDQGLASRQERRGTASYSLAPRASGQGTFVITERTATSKSSTSYRSFNAFQAALTQKLGAGTARKVALVALGRESVPGAAFTCDAIFVGLAP